MPKQVSLKKVWHLCNNSLNHNHEPSHFAKAKEAYALLRHSQNTLVQSLLSKFGNDLLESNIENICVFIEHSLQLPVKDSDFNITTRDLQKSKNDPCSLIFYLYNIRSGFNIGSMIRLSDGFNIREVILSGYTATPENMHVKRTSLGAENNIVINKDDDDLTHLKRLKNDGYHVVALETVKNSESVLDYKFPERTVLIVGNERKGLPQTLLNIVDSVVHIPMFGVKNSLNVVSALSMCSYEWVKQWR